jgi:uncharacterized protein (TIGR02646 family)
MRYIQKKTTPRSFINKTSSLKIWKDYHECCFNQKQALKKYILHCEQNNLCVYCESKITIRKESSHFEHIKPKSIDIDNLTFSYNNLSVSCNGTCNNEVNDKVKYNCGHKKDDEYDETKFLNPFKNKDIRLYFQYDYDDFKILPSNKDIAKAKYMIDTLQLNSSRLIIARRNKYKSFKKKLKKIRDIEKQKDYLKNVLDSESVEFVSFFRYKYNKLDLHPST